MAHVFSLDAPHCVYPGLPHDETLLYSSSLPLLAIFSGPYCLAFEGCLYHVIAFSAHSLLDSRLSWLPCRLTFLVHPCVRVLFHGHIFFCSPPDVTIFHPYSVLWLLPTALQTRSSALTAV